MNNKVKLDVFGIEIDINPLGYIVTVEKLSEGAVLICNRNQGEMVFKEPVHTLNRFGKTADEFISEFRKQNLVAVKDFENKNK